MVTPSPSLRSLQRSSRDSTPLDARREATLLQASQGGDRNATGELVTAHMRLVCAVARRITATPSEDVIAEGVVGLLEAIARFDPSRGARLSTYAAHWIRARVQTFVLANRGIVGSPDTRAARRVFARIGRTRRALAVQTSEPRVEELAEAMGVTSADVEGVILALRPRELPVGNGQELGYFEPPCEDASPEDRVAERELTQARKSAIESVLAALPARERRVVQERALAEDGRTLDDLAVELQLSRERVRQLEARALRRMGETFAERGLAA
jgi:RNA polymerase sigma-32 factor